MFTCYMYEGHLFLHTYIILKSSNNFIILNGFQLIFESLKQNLFKQLYFYLFEFDSFHHFFLFQICWLVFRTRVHNQGKLALQQIMPEDILVLGPSVCGREPSGSCARIHEYVLGHHPTPHWGRILSHGCHNVLIENSRKVFNCW